MYGLLVTKEHERQFIEVKTKMDDQSQNASLRHYILNKHQEVSEEN